MQAVQLPQRSSAPMVFPRVGMLTSERWLIGVHIISALFALSFGILMGPFQTFRRAPAFVHAFPEWQIPVFSYYYQALTMHGVMNALFFTTFFIVGFSYFVTQRSLQRPINQTMGWIAFGLMFLGLGLILYAISTNQANVLYTFYSPMLAHATFYIGLVLLAVGSWVAGAAIFMTYLAWKKEHPGERVPLAVFAIIVNQIMWQICTIGVAIEILTLLLPASLGFLFVTDVQVGRALFWFFGHPLVYFWLIPAYVSWYTMLPTQAGGKLFSDSLGRVAFIMLLIFSLPVGVHHLYADPGVSAVSKGIHTVLTFVVAIPSFMTAFNVGASLEYAARKRGARGPLGWLFRQKWSDPVVVAQLGGMILFIMGGFSGLINASLTLNIALHNTAWIPAHFHMTLGGAVTLTYIGITYWLLPMLRGRALFSNKMALAQVWTWVVGMLIFGHGMGTAGIAGAPRRTDVGMSPYLNETATFWLNSSAIGGFVLLISSILLYANVVGTLAFSTKPYDYEPPIAHRGDPNSPLWLERWGLWIGITLFLILIAWAPVFIESLNFVDGFNAPFFNPARPSPITP